MGGMEGIEGRFGSEKGWQSGKGNDIVRAKGKGRREEKTTK